MEDNNQMLFGENNGKIISQADYELWEKVIVDWGTFIKTQSRKGLVPLFITGSGVSMPEKNGSDTSTDANIPGVGGIIDYLSKRYTEKKKAGEFQNSDQFEEIKNLFDKYKTPSRPNKPDRVIVASLLNAFQENDQLKDKVWSELNDWLLNEILNAKPTLFHSNLAKLYRDDNVNAVSMTLNFDGLLIRQFLKDKSRAFSLPNKKDIEKFILRSGNQTTKPEKEYLEIQIRGDILYVKCNSKQFCPNNSSDIKHSLWAHISSKRSKDDFLKCPHCGEKGSSYLSFPGSYEKEKDMRKILEVVWRYLAFRISCVTVVGLSGEWDPLIVAFLGDLLSERDIPLLVVNKNAHINNQSYIIKGLVTPGIHSSISLKSSANDFSQKLVDAITNCKLSPSDNPIYDHCVSEDEFWYEELKKEGIGLSINRQFSKFENELRIAIIDTIKLHNFAQIGLKSYWLGLVGTDLARHNRLNHSIGVMKIASFLYEKAIKNTKLQENVFEKQFLRIAALLHDVGHLPFSHLIEGVFDELGWTPGGYQNSYSHAFQTQININNLFDKNRDLCNYLKEIGYSVKDVIALVNGCFGVGFLDAIINSPIDADKIDYIFRDTHSTGKKISLSPRSFLEELTSGIFITPEKFLAFSGNSAKAARDLLNTRLFLYNNLYLQPGIIILEGIVKLLIKTYFVHKVSIVDIENSSRQVSKKEVDSQDLGMSKIDYCIQDLMKLTENEDNTIEEKILKNMSDTLSEKEYLFHNHFFENLKKGFDLVKNTRDAAGLKKIEESIICKRFICKKSMLTDIIKTVLLRIPGAAIIETAKPPNILSMSDVRKERERSDGTKQCAECILVPGGDPGIWDALSKAEVPLVDSLLKNKTKDDIPVYFYPLSGNIKDINFVQCRNLFEKLLKESGITSTSEVEEG